MKNYTTKTTQLLQRLFKFLLTILSLALFLSSPLWLPPIFSFLKIFSAVAFDAKCLFIVFNIIIVILFRQSKFSMSSYSSSPYDVVYEEYVSRNKSSVQRLCTSSEALEENDVVIEERQESSDDHEGLDELNKRVEDFIARVNKQRRIEARQAMKKLRRTNTNELASLEKKIMKV